LQVFEVYDVAKIRICRVAVYFLGAAQNMPGLARKNRLLPIYQTLFPRQSNFYFWTGKVKKNRKIGM
jgi:hypothetical protein